MPAIVATGTKTRRSVTRTSRRSGADTSRIASTVASLADMPLFHLLRHGLDHDDRVVDDDADREHEAEQ